MTTPRDPRLTALLGAPERDLEPHPTRVPGLLEETDPEQLERTLAGASATAGVGELLQRARQRRGLSLRAAARAAGRSASRIVAVERATTDINVSTLVQTAHALGYRVEVTLSSTDAREEPIATSLDRPGDAAEAPQAKPTAYQATVRLPARRSKAPT